MQCNPISDPELGKLFDHLSTAVLVADANLQVVKTNAAAENLLELSAGKMLSTPLIEIFGSAPEIEHLIDAVRSENRAYTERDLRFVTPGLKQRLVDCTVSPWQLKDHASDFLVVELASVERHQRIQLEETMLMQNQATAALMRGLAHEVKNPLGGIRGAAQLLERELAEPAQTEFTQIIIGEADRLRTLVDRMLGPRGKIDLKAVNIHEVLERVNAIVEAEQHPAVEIIRDYDPSLPEVRANRDELIQAFLNIVRNAVQALGETGGQITIRTRAQRSITIANRFHRLAISTEIIDNGPGVDPSIAESIFFPMVSGRAEGSGLGLPLSQAMINRYGGLIGFTSEPGHTVFNVWLPVGTENESS